MAAPQLSKKQRKKALANLKTNVGPKQGKKKITTKSVLCTPYVVQWPRLESDVEKVILLKLIDLFTKIELKRPVISKKLKKKERKDALETFYNSRSNEQTNLRTQLVCGVNEITKWLEKDKLMFVLVNKSCDLLTNHLIQLAALRNCTAIQLSGLTKCVAPLISVTQLSCLGFRKTSTSMDPSFKEFADFVILKAPKIDLPWLTFEKSVNEFANKMQESVMENEDVEMIKKNRGMIDKSDDDLSESCEESTPKDDMQTKNHNIKLGVDTSKYVEGNTNNCDLNISSVHEKNVKNKQKKRKRKNESDKNHQMTTKKRKVVATVEINNLQDKKNVGIQSNSFKAKYSNISLHKMQPNMQREKKKDKKKKE